MDDRRKRARLQEPPGNARGDVDVDMHASSGNGKMDGTDLPSFMKRQTNDVIELLFREPACCLAAFSILNPLAKQFVFRLLFLDGDAGLDKRLVDGWTTPTPDGRRHGEAAQRSLDDLQVWCHDTATNTVRLQSDFKAGLKTVVAGGGHSWVDRASLEGQKKTKKRETLQGHADEKWEGILSSMVAGTTGNVDGEVLTTLFQANLLSGVPGSHAVTKTGFQFLLQERREQIWFYLFRYMELQDWCTEQLGEALSFIFKLGFSQLGDDMPMDTLTEHQKHMLPRLYELGLILYTKKKRYYPTQSAVSLMEPTEGTNSSGTKGYLIVETNFRVYAYDARPLQNDLLSLFTEIRYMLPGVTVGMLTRDSVRRAYRNGIKAQQLAYFLKIHAHPRMSETGTDREHSAFPPIPGTVIHQLFLWEQERKRVSLNSGKLYTFESSIEFESVRAFASQNGHLLWEDASLKKMVVSVPGHKAVKQFKSQNK